MNTHVFDAAIRLVADGDSAFVGKTSADYANMVGPFGGTTAATLLNAAWLHPARLGEPLTLTINYAGPLADGPFRVAAKPARTNRSTQHWFIELVQADEVAATATAIFGTRRDTWSSTEIGFPSVPVACAIERTPPLARAAWTHHYDMRFVRGGFPDFTRPAVESDSVTCLWIRDEPPRTLDFLSLTAMCDAFIPRIFVRRPRWTPAGTVCMTTYFHADSHALAAQGDRAVLGTARAVRFGNGYFDQAAEIWSDDRTLLATSYQLVYYKD